MQVAINMGQGTSPLSSYEHSTDPRGAHKLTTKLSKITTYYMMVTKAVVIAINFIILISHPVFDSIC